MGKENININLERIIKKIPIDNIIDRVLREAISNSIHAKATQINCKFKTMPTLIENECDIDEMIIEDNGEGFTADNLNSFKIYGTDYKAEKWGAKGTGRFCFLKITDKIVYKSLKQIITLDTNYIDVKQSSENYDNKTILELKNLRYEKDKKILFQTNRFDKLMENIRISLLPTLILIKQNNFLDNLEINFYRDNKAIGKISLIEIPQVEKQNIIIESNGKNTDFELLYYIDKHTKSDTALKIGSYCADLIKVKDFNFDINLPKISYIFLVKSDYLDSNVNDDRADFLIKSKIRGTLTYLTWFEIESHLKEVIQKILNKVFNDMEEKNKNSFDEATKKFPFFKNKFNEINAKSVGYLSVKDYVKSSYDTLDIVKEDLRKLQYESLGRELTENEFNTILSNSSIELAEYIVNRQIVINEMQNFIKDNITDEKQIHNLIIPQGEVYTHNDSFVDLKNCNLWIIDDKFMSFSKALSDKKIKELKKQISQDIQIFEGDNQEPDLFIYFDSEQKKKLVTIEIKPFGNKKTIDRNKINSITQIADYADFINNHFKEIPEKWYYTITTIDDNFKRQLRINNYKKIFSNGEMYFSYNPELQTYFYILDMQTLVDDARARNKVFMDILTNFFDKE
ncbi:hypothetical protein CCZ01_09615 [Helicobacter monodelphidis]|uniref:ATP-binding protein n=1 Tax=Helicobacter sp. 15-1451 TaxID=2004995 RepID=UPI000DCBD403|nr:ATP-binding protein [Helicobacter sp. 15-1451]RAX56402.1 hypothetical protein CCZ01_09615 [Helicobacter sp. 15-1451]